MDDSPAGSPVHGILQAIPRALPCSPPGDLANPGIKPLSLASSALAGVFFTTSATWEAWLVLWYSVFSKGDHILDVKIQFTCYKIH